MWATFFVACGDDKPSGKYVAEKDSKAVVEFDGDKIIVTYDGEEEVNGTFKIDGDKIIITEDGEDETLSYAKDGDTVTIEGEKYTKK